MINVEPRSSCVLKKVSTFTVHGGSVGVFQAVFLVHLILSVNTYCILGYMKDMKAI